MKRFFPRAIPPLVCRQPNRATALLMVIWILAFLGFLLAGVIELANLDFELEARAAADMEALRYAESALAIGLHPSVQPYDPVLRQEPEPGIEMQAIIRGEQGRIKISAFLQEEQTDLLERLFRIWGIPQDEIDKIITALLDWVDPDDLARINGAEADQYQRAGLSIIPRNGPLASLDELEGVMGFTVLMHAKPNWRDYFTLFGDGKIDINSAGPEVLEALCYVTNIQAERFVQLRNGFDAESDTEDDILYELKDFSKVMGMSSSVFERIQSLLTAKSQVQRVTGIGRVGKCERTIITVVTRGSSKPTLLSWTEE